MHFGNFMIIGLLSFPSYCLKSAVPQGNTAHAIIIIIFILTCYSVTCNSKLVRGIEVGYITRIHVRID